MMNLKEFSACLIRFSRCVPSAFAAGVFLFAGTVMPVTGQHASDCSSGNEVEIEAKVKVNVNVETTTKTETESPVLIEKPVVGLFLNQEKGISADLVRNPAHKEQEGITAGMSGAMYKFRSDGKPGNHGISWSDETLFRSSIRVNPDHLGFSFRENLYDTPVASDTVPHPRSVMFRSLILPGWGQVTNRQVWKVPIVYALLGGLTYYSIYSHGMYSDYRAAYYNIATGNDDFRFGPTPPRLAGVPPESLRDTRNFFRNRRDFTFILIGLAYGLNVLDAYIFAHFRDFDVSDDLSHISALHPEPFGSPVFSFRYRIRF